VLASLVLGFVYSAPVWAQSDTTGRGPQPVCLLLELRKDLGETFEQDKYSYAFKVKNAGEADLKIVGVRPG